MADRRTRQCVVCGKEYKFCPNCREDKGKPLFYFTFCSENCRDICDITSAYEGGVITADEAKERAGALDLSKKDSFGESYKKSIDNIMGVADNTESDVNFKVSSKRTTKKNVE